MEEQEFAVPSLFIIPLTEFLVACLLFIALLYGQRDLAMLTLLVLGIVGGVRLWTRFSLSGVTWHFVVDKQKAFPDERITLIIRAENRKFLPIRLRVIVPIKGLMHLSKEKVLKKESSLLWFQRAQFQWELTAHRRGIHHIGPLHVLAGDLFAFFSKEKRKREFHEIVVYPRLIPVQFLSLPRRDFFGIPGSRSPVQDPIYILGTRDYHHGRPAKHIHWKASARHNRLQEKVLESTQQEKALFVLDSASFAENRADEEFERTIEVVASLAAQFDRRGLAIGLVTNAAMAPARGSAVAPIARSHEQLAVVLEALARVQMASRGDILETLRTGSILTWGVACIHFCYEEDEIFPVVARHYRSLNIPAVFFVSRRRNSSEGQYPIRDVHELMLEKAKGT